ncbi:MAG: hypothetical protein IKV89_01400 [Clostridia bacterium]|nr:hypothetical protein [Clostridia bacterium]
MSNARKDLTGQRFGRLTAIRSTGERKNGSYVWECKCDCGNIKFVVAYSLTTGGTKSCGCLRPKKEKTDDINESVISAHDGDTPILPLSNLQGQKFGMLTAVRPTDRWWRGNVVWECLCECGNTTYMCATHLKRGSHPSCGCTRKIEDLSGQKFGKLTVIGHMGVLSNSPVTWNCLCDCGNRVYVIGRRLKDGSVHSCGCE